MTRMDIETKLREIEAEKERLDRERETLLREVESRESRKRELLELIERSGYGTPQQLVNTLAGCFEIRLPKPKGAVSAARTRVTVTPQIRDEVKSLLGSGKKGPEVARLSGVSYQTVRNIAKGKYDHL